MEHKISTKRPMGADRSGLLTFSDRKDFAVHAVLHAVLSFKLPCMFILSCSMDTTIS